MMNNQNSSNLKSQKKILKKTCKKRINYGIFPHWQQLFKIMKIKISKNNL